MIDYNKFEKAQAEPEASSMIETFRAIGYSIEAAVADIIDNSISAFAKNIWVSFNWNGSETSISIKDDGHGMNNNELIQAMRPGSKNPLDDRSIKDLGRFGLGLKTASFSQCRQLSVISKKENEDPVFWTWDLDFVKQSGKWQLLKYLPDSSYEKEIIAQESGTIVIWNQIDRYLKNTSKEDRIAQDKFQILMEQVRKHLAMVFHRFIESGKIKIWCWNRIIEPWNPFQEKEPATQVFPEELLCEGQISVKGFVLPHKSKQKEQNFKLMEGIKGWNDQQGFYVYRNERMLLSGDWLGMFRKEEHYKLARIQIDVPNSLDTDWQIDIKKSIARPPLFIRDQLKAYAQTVRAQAVEVYRHKGKSVRQLPGQRFIPLWVEHKRGDKWFYKINRNHPLIEKTKNEAKADPDKAIEMMLRYIEETIPTKSIYIKEAEEPEAQGKPFEGVDTEPILNAIKQMFENLKKSGKTNEDAKSIILNIEPFNHFPHLLEFIE